MQSNKLVIGFIVMVYWIIIVASGYMAVKTQSYNGDIMTYMGVILKIENGRTENIGPLRNSIAEQQIPAKRFHQLISREAENQKKTSKPHHVSFGAIKPLYLAFVLAFNLLGVPLVKATVLPSALSYVAIGLLLFHWLRKYLVIVMAFIVALLTMQWSVIFNIARLSSPDCLSAFFIFYAMYLLIEKKANTQAYIMLLLSVFTRLDNGIFCFMLITMFATIRVEGNRISTKSYLLAIAGLLVTYCIVMSFAMLFGWNILFFTTYTEHLAYNGDKEVFNPNVYIDTLLMTLDYTIHKSLILKFLICASLILLCKRKGWAIDQWVTVLIIAVFIIRYLIYPFTHDRFYLGYYLIFIMSFVRAFAERFGKHKEVQTR